MVSAEYEFIGWDGFSVSRTNVFTEIGRHGKTVKWIDRRLTDAELKALLDRLKKILVLA